MIAPEGFRYNPWNHCLVCLGCGTSTPLTTLRPCPIRPGLVCMICESEKPRNKTPSIWESL